MRGEKFQPQIQELIVRLSTKFPDIEWFKEGPIGQDIQTNVLGQKEGYYIKAFTQEGKEQGKKELAAIHAFNQSAAQIGGYVSGPEIIESSTMGDVYFIMKDIKKSGKLMLDFPQMSAQECIQVYDIYRKEFDQFEKRMSSTAPKISIEKWVQAQTEKIHKGFARGYATVTGYVSYDTTSLLGKLEDMQDKIHTYEIEYSFGNFRTGHVFSDGVYYQLVDFDNIKYQVKGVELLGIMWSHLLLPVEEYETYAQRRGVFQQWYEYIGASLQHHELVERLLLQKLIGTIFHDFGYLMLNLEANRKKIHAKGHNVEANAKKGIEWNLMLMDELW